MDNAFWSWSLKIYRTSSLEVRASWMLGVWMLFDVMRFIKSDAYTLCYIPLLFIPLVMYVHAMAHVGMARLVGGQADVTILSIINDRTSMQIPLNPAKQFSVAAAGPLVSFVLGLVCAFIAPLMLDPSGKTPAQLHFLMTPYPTGNTSDLGGYLFAALEYFSHLNLLVFLANLLACAMFDGARMWRALLWPLVGLSRAIRGTVLLSYVCSLFILAISLYFTDWTMLFFGLMCFIVTVQEHRSIKLGFDPVLQIEFENTTTPRSQSWFGRWQQRRAVRARELGEREESEEQLILDRLLVKVSEQGLPSLTAAERSSLQRISRKQKNRQEHGVL